MNSTPIGVYWRPSPAFIDDLCQFLTGRRVLEIFAGNGYLASLLADKGIDVKATSILSSMDAHQIKLYCDVEDINAVQAVHQYGAERDVLLICWPTVTLQVLSAAELWGSDRDIVFIGEVTDYSKGHLGGCATDEFFDSIAINHVFESYVGRIIEKAMVARVKPLDQRIPHTELLNARHALRVMIAKQQKMIYFESTE